MKLKQVFWFILTVAIALRFFKLGSIPFGYNWDETSIIYNSWGIALWHRDEWANLMPLAFRSFGDYKAPLMFYLLAVPFKFFGVIEPLIRIYSATAGVITVIATYFISKELFPQKKLIAPISMFLVSISPWAINFSRVGFEANLGLSIVSLGILFLLLGKKKPKFWLLSAFFFSVSLYAYHSTKIFVPLFLLIFLFQNKKFIASRPKVTIISALLFLVLSLPIGYVTLFGNGFERGLTMIFFDDQHQLRSSALIFREFIQNSLNQISPQFLVGGIDSVGLRHLVSGSGILYAVELPFLLYGIIKLILSKNKSSRLLIFWLVIGFMPAILSHQTPHAVRSLLVIPSIQILTAFGFFNFFTKIKSQTFIYKSLFMAIPLLFLLINFFTYIHSYYTTYATSSALEFQYGYKQALKIASDMGRTKEKIVVTDKYGQPYVYVLLHNRIKPEEFLAGALANYEFHQIPWPYYKPNSIIVGTPEEIPPTDAAVKHVVYIPNTNQPVFVIAQTPSP